MDLTKALAPKSDQLDFADLEGLAPQVFTITSVSENGSELADQQPVNIGLAEFPRVWRPSKGMLRVLADNWGKDVTVWVGRQVELYGDPEVYFGKEKRGGTRISRLSHIPKRNKTLINPRGGRGAYWIVDPLPTSAPASTSSPTADLLNQVRQAAEAAGVDLATVAAEWAESHDGQPIKDATDVGGLELLRDDLRGRAS
jgi:hypothetical protein